MPEPLSVDEFIKDTLSDVRDPKGSDFISKISSVRCTVHQLDEGIENDRSVLLKTKKLVKCVISSGIGHADSIISFCDYLEKLGQVALEGDDLNGTDIAASLCKFSVVHRDVANMSKHLMQNMNSIVVFPMESFMQGDVKTDLKKPFEKALKDYECKYDKLRKEKVQVMKDTGIYTPEAFTVEMIEDLEKERRKLQLETCEYLIKVNELKAKRGSDLLQHLIDYYYAHIHYLRECLSVMEHFGKSMNDLTTRVSVLHKVNDAQKRRLMDTREEVRNLMERDSTTSSKKPRHHTQSSQAGVTYAAQPTQIDQQYGTTKNGFLLKRSDGKVKRVWQRRRVRIGDGELHLYHADETKPPVRLGLLTCQVKLPADAVSQQQQSDGADASGNPSNSHLASDMRNLFDLVSNSRTYNFQTENDQDFKEWINVLKNAMQQEFHRAMNVDDTAGNDTVPGTRNNSNSNTTPDLSVVPSHIFGRMGVTEEGSLGGSLVGSDKDFESSSLNSRSHDSRLGSSDVLSTDLMQSSICGPDALKGKALHSAIQSALPWCCPGNDTCADCNRPDPEWVSVNLGVLICLECCGAHRELGVHCSRTQSLLMDDLSTNQLLLPRFVGNNLFNEVFEASLSEGIKPKPVHVSDVSGMLQRRNYIKAKYIDRKYTSSRSTVITTVNNGQETQPPDPIAERFLRRDLLRAVRTSDMGTLIQVFAEGFDLMTPFLPDDDAENWFSDSGGMTPLHLAVERCRPAELHASGRELDPIATSIPSPLAIVEFILQNSASSHCQRTNKLGETALHHATRTGSVDTLKLLLQCGGLPTPMLRLKNTAGQTSLALIEDLVISHQSKSPTDSTTRLTEAYESCQELLRLAEAVATKDPSLEPTDALFSCSDYMERRTATTRTELLERIDQLSCVDWALSTHRQNQQQLTAKHHQPQQQHQTKLVNNSATTRNPWTKGWNLTGNQSDTSPAKSAFGAKEGNHSIGTDDGDSFMMRMLPYGNALATMPRKKGPAPRPPSVGSQMSSAYADYDSLQCETSDVAYPNATIASRDRACSRTTALSHRGKQSNLRKSITAGRADESWHRWEEWMHSSLRSGNRPISVNSSTMAANASPSLKNSENGSSAPHGVIRRRSVEHIDILLDVLEEKPSSGSAGTTAAPPVPPKPTIPSTRWHSTLPSRHHATSTPVRLKPLDPPGDNPPSSHSPANTPFTTRSSLAPSSPSKNTTISPTNARVSSVHTIPSDDPNTERMAIGDSRLGDLLEALHDCDAEHSDELTFRRGEVIELAAKSDEDWWEGFIHKQPWRRGLFPATYVKCHTPVSCSVTQTSPCIPTND